MQKVLGILGVACLVGLAACDGSSRSVTGPNPIPSFNRQSNSSTPEVPAGQRPQPNPNKSRSTHGNH
jgi:hypothetical protein